MVSCTRSSASAGLPVRRRATRYRLSRWISASRSKLARLSASAAGVGGAGRRAARRAVRRLFGLTRLMARAAPRVFGYAAARRAARAVFGAELRRERHVPIARVRDTLAVHATPDGAACALYGTGFTELLRLLVGFEGAMLHVSCRATGGEACEWRAAPPDPAHHRRPR